MRYFLFFFLSFAIAILMSSCASSDYEDQYYEMTTKYPTSPCKDSLYQVLKKRPLDSLTDRQFQYFTTKDKDCQEYTRFQRQIKVMEDEEASRNTTRGVLIGLSVVSLLITIVIISLNHH
jgi:hypothetical protein